MALGPTTSTARDMKSDGGDLQQVFLFSIINAGGFFLTAYPLRIARIAHVMYQIAVYIGRGTLPGWQDNYPCQAHPR